VLPLRSVWSGDDSAPASVFFVYGGKGQFAEKDPTPTYYYRSAQKPKHI